MKITPDSAFERSYPDKLPPAASIPRGRQKPRWQRKVAETRPDGSWVIPRDGSWNHADTMAETSAYQVALRANSARESGSPWLLASIVEGDKSHLYVSYQP